MNPRAFDSPRWDVRAAALKAADYAAFDAVLQIGGSNTPFAKEIAAAAKKRGDSSSPTICTLRGGTAVIKISWRKADSVFSHLESLRRHFAPLAKARKIAVDIRDSAATESAVFAILAGAAVFAGGPDSTRKPPRLTFAGCNRKIAKIAAESATANILARTLQRMPPNELTVPEFTRIARTLAKQNPRMSSTIWNATELQKMNAGLICAVGRAAENPPCIVRIRYSGNPKSRRIVFVGKGVCYDTGGVNIKPARHMRGMKKDMSGAASALAAVLAAAALQLPVNADAYLALAENAAGPQSYRPDDVVTSMSGKTVEVVHSDAEGRMILADAMTLAARKTPDADFFVSFATLTGTMHIALGERISGVFASAPYLLKKAQIAAAASGERLCAFPLANDYATALKSDVADIKQCAEEGTADHIMAALFLRDFLPPDSPWLHLDLSAASCKGGLGVAPGPETGFGAVWALELLKRAKP